MTARRKLCKIPSGKRLVATKRRLRVIPQAFPQFVQPTLLWLFVRIRGEGLCTLSLKIFLEPCSLRPRELEASVLSYQISKQLLKSFTN